MAATLPPVGRESLSASTTYEQRTRRLYGRPGVGMVPGILAGTIGVDLAGILRETHGERRRWVTAEWSVVW